MVFCEQGVRWAFPSGGDQPVYVYSWKYVNELTWGHYLARYDLNGEDQIALCPYPQVWLNVAMDWQAATGRLRAKPL